MNADRRKDARDRDVSVAKLLNEAKNAAGDNAVREAMSDPSDFSTVRGWVEISVTLDVLTAKAIRLTVAAWGTET
jgi:hypothetical protein